MFVPVYDKEGSEVNRIEIQDTITHINGRVCKGKKNYYKGLGAPYHGQWLSPDTKDLNGYSYVHDSGVFYIGPYVKKYCFENKTGIFQEKFQPQFTDFIGSCGAKELSIIENSEEFDRSSLKIIKCENYDKENGQYYFVLDYACERRKYIEGGDAIELYKLLEYMIQNDWNFIWDKNSIEDISYNGLVSDVGDIFKSSSLISKLGTTYSVLYSLHKSSPNKYREFKSFHNIKSTPNLQYVCAAIELLERFGVDTKELYISNDTIVNLKHIVMNYLVVGKNCGDCCFIELGDQIREQYLEQTKKQLGLS